MPTDTLPVTDRADLLATARRSGVPEFALTPLKQATPLGRTGTPADIEIIEQGLWRAANRGYHDEITRLYQYYVQPDSSVLEIGCGPGLALSHCAHTIVTGHIVGIDHSEVMIAQAARRNTHALQRGALDLRVGGLELLHGMQGERFSKVLNINVAQFFADRVEAFRAIGAVMSAGGVIATTHQPRRAGATQADALAMSDKLVAALLAAGFAAPRTELLPLLPVPAICILARRP